MPTEFEADSRADVLRAAEPLGYREADLTAESTVGVYARHGIDPLTVPRVGFGENQFGAGPVLA
jgi:adenylate cyclase, class 2